MARPSFNVSVPDTCSDPEAYASILERRIRDGLVGEDQYDSGLDARLSGSVVIISCKAEWFSEVERCAKDARILSA